MSLFDSCAVSLRHVLAYRFPTIRKDLLAGVDVSDVEAVNIVVIGPARCGKTSFVDTCNRYLQREAASMEFDLSEYVCIASLSVLSM